MHRIQALHVLKCPERGTEGQKAYNCTALAVQRCGQACSGSFSWYVSAEGGA